MDCSGSGNPPPTFQFGKVMPAVGLQDPVTKMIDANYPDKRFTIKDSTLIINNLNASDGGIYVCFAKNQFGEVLKELIVKIRGNCFKFSLNVSLFSSSDVFLP